MVDERVREIVRETIARHLGRESATSRPGGSGRTHPSYELFPIASGGEGDGTCLIEPAVRCNHCGYCRSHGH